jgi:hypothetical protein
VDQEGKALDPQPHRVLFEGGETTINIRNKNQIIKLSPLKISQEIDRDKESYLDCQGAYPVIFMSWKDIKPKTFEQFKETIK